MIVLGSVLPAALPAHAAIGALYHFVGTVTDGDGRPLAGATVSDGGQSTQTDGNGHYSLGESSTGSFTLDALRSDTGLSTQQVNVLIPVDTTVNFTLLYLASSKFAQTYVSTANGPVTDSMTITSWAPNPGGGQAGDSCVTVTDSRSNAISPATLQSVNANGSSTWTASVTLPTGSTQGVGSLTALGVDCSTHTTLTVSAPAQYLVDNTRPVITPSSPGARSGPNTTVAASVTDSGGSGLNPNSLAVTVDGASVASSFDASSSQLKAPLSRLAAGPHSVVISAADNASNTAQATFSFTVDNTAPALAQPEPTGTVGSSTPLISIAVTDPDSILSGTSTTFQISNGVISNALNPSYDQSSGRATYQVPSTPTGTGLGQFPLPDGTYTITATARDDVGNESTLSWTFQITETNVNIPLI